MKCARLLIILLVSVAVLLAACGDDEDNDSDEPSGPAGVAESYLKAVADNDLDRASQYTSSNFNDANVTVFTMLYAGQIEDISCYRLEEYDSEIRGEAVRCDFTNTAEGSSHSVDFWHKNGKLDVFMG